jgi:hypothetical protein
MFENNSSYDLHIKLRTKQETGEYEGNVHKGEIISFGIVFSGTGIIVVPVDRWSFQNPNDHIDKIVFTNLGNNQVIKEMDYIRPENISEDHAYRTYRIKITDDLLLGL